MTVDGDACTVAKKLRGICKASTVELAKFTHKVFARIVASVLILWARIAEAHNELNGCIHYEQLCKAYASSVVSSASSSLLPLGLMIEATGRS